MTSAAWTRSWGGPLSELEAALLIAITVGAALAALPRRAGAVKPAWGLAPVVTLGLAVLLSLACAGVIGITLLGQLGWMGCLAGVSGVLVAASAARIRPGRGWGLALLLIGGLVVAVLLSGQVPGVNAHLNPVATLGQELGGANPNLSQPFLLLLLCWGNGAWVGWWAMRERAAAVAVGAPMVLLIADLVNVPPAVQGAPLWAVLGAVVSGMALLGWAHQESRLSRWAGQGVPLVGAGPTRGLAVVLTCALGLGALAVILPPLSHSNISQRFFHSGPPVPPTIVQSEQVAPVSGYSTAVVPGGPIRQVETPVLSYTTSAPGGTVYLQGAALSQFSNGNWYEQPTSARTVGPGQFLPYSEQPDQGTLALDAGRQEVSLRVTYIGSGADQVGDLLYPGSPLQTPQDPGRYVAHGQVSGNQLLTVATVVPKSGVSALLPSSESLTTYGSISTATAAQLESAGKNYPAWVMADAALPPGGSFLAENQLAADAVAMAGDTTNPYLIAINLQNALRADEIYTLNPPKVPAGEWPIVFFLDQSHRGYCQYFASAMGAMLRTLGIPSRLVTGFGPGQEGTLPNGQWLITQADAHTWVQVYFPGYGWVNFEPTPDGFYQPTGATTTTAPDHTPPAHLRSHPGVRSVAPSGKAPAAARRHPGPGLGWGPVALTVGLALLVAAGIGFAWTRRASTPGQVRRRLELPIRLSLAGDPRAWTLPELARGCAELAADPGDLGLNAALIHLGQEGDRVAFGPPGPAAPRDLASEWGQVRGGYPRLLWRGWRAGRRRRRSTPISAPRVSLGRTW